MLNWLLNIFRENKRYVFYPDNCCSGTGVAVAEFLRYKKTLEESSERKVVMVKTYSIFGMTERVVYEIRTKEQSDE